jgi:hypothetical protein
MKSKKHKLDSAFADIPDEGVAFQDYTMKPWYKRLTPFHFVVYGWLGLIIIFFIIYFTHE